jgi:hypothetical protein
MIAENPLRVLIAGGGVAGLEAMLALRELADDRVVWGAQTRSALETGRFAAGSNLRTPHGVTSASGPPRHPFGELRRACRRYYFNLGRPRFAERPGHGLILFGAFLEILQVRIQPAPRPRVLGTANRVSRQESLYCHWFGHLLMGRVD